MKLAKFFCCLLLVVPFLTTSCDKVIEEPQNEETFTQVTFGFTGSEFLISEAPITKAGDVKDWYVFQVYYRVAGSNNAYTYYAYGFFDNKNDMIINLKNGYEYKFDVCMLPEASTRVYCFATHSEWAQINNSFVISSSESVRYMYDGYLYMNYPSWTTYDRPRVDRFMGRTEGYVPTEGGVVSIEMKRVSFAAKFVPKNFVSGSLEISVEGAGTTTMRAGSDTECQDFFSFKYPGNALSAALNNAEYSESVPVNVVWVKEDGVRSPIANQNITFKRNVLTTVEFEVKESSASNSFSFTSNDTLQNGDTVTIGGDGTNTGVNPN